MVFCICPKVKVKFELVYYDSAVQRFNHYTTMTPGEYVSEQLMIKQI